MQQLQKHLVKKIITQSIFEFPSKYLSFNNVKIDSKYKYDSICVYESINIPIATVYSVALKLPLGIIRNNSKGYGTNKMIEGYPPKENANIILFCSHTSKELETILKPFNLKQICFIETTE